MAQPIPSSASASASHTPSLDVEESDVIRVLRDDGFSATRAVERVTADPGTSSVAPAFSVVGVPWRMLTTLSTDERLMWLVWTWAIAGAVLLSRRWRMMS